MPDTITPSSPAPAQPAAAPQPQMEALRQRVALLESELAAARQSAAQATHLRQLEAALTEAQTIDLEAARLLAQSVLEAGGSDLTIPAAVAELQRRRPWLFKTGPARPTAQAMPPRHLEAEAAPAAAARPAAQSGQRRDLLHYLRLRRAK